MLIDGEKWACEACVRGHRVTTCKHHDRPLIHINRKGRPFATCSVCNCTPCEAPEEHAKLKREADAKCQASKVEPPPAPTHSIATPLPPSPPPAGIWATRRIPKPTLSSQLHVYTSIHIYTHPPSIVSRDQSKADVALRFASCSSFQRAAGRSPRSTSVGSLKPIAPRPAPSSTGGCGSSSGGAGGAAAGLRRASHSPPTGDHRPRSTLSASPPPPPPPPPQSQLYQQQPQAPGHGQGHGLIPGTPGDSPLYLPGPASAYPPSPTYCTIGDGMPGSLSMVNPLDFEGGIGVSFADSASAAAIYALEDLDVNSLPVDVFQGDWSWLADEAALRDAV